jgi:hypothetical protein
MGHVSAAKLQDGETKVSPMLLLTKARRATGGNYLSLNQTELVSQLGLQEINKPIIKN